jgi:hypothetical protein
MQGDGKNLSPTLCVDYPTLRPTSLLGNRLPTGERSLIGRNTLAGCVLSRISK